MAPRAYWKGYLKLSLVSCPIALSPAASSSERISFRQINKKTGNRLRQQLVDDETREPVDAPRTRAGATKSTRASTSRSTTTRSRPSRSRASTPSTSTASSPRRKSTSASTTAPITSRRPTAWGRKRSRSSATPCAARAWSRSAASCSPSASASSHWSRAARACWGRRCATPTRCAKPEEYFSDIEDIKVPGEMLKLAEHIVDTKAGDFDPTAFEDHYETALVELLRKKQAGFKPPKTKEHVAAPRNVINLMDALRRSVAGRAGGAGAGEEGPQARRRAAGNAIADRGQAGTAASGCQETGRAPQSGLTYSSPWRDEIARCHYAVLIAGGRRLISQPQSQFADICVRDMQCWPRWSSAGFATTAPARPPRRAGRPAR